MIPVSYYIGLSLILFVTGVVGFIVRRNAIIAFMCIELMLNAANIAFVSLSEANANLDGHIAVFFVIVIAAAEAAVGLAIILALFRNFRSVLSSDACELKN